MGNGTRLTERGSGCEERFLGSSHAGDEGCLLEIFLETWWLTELEKSRDSGSRDVKILRPRGRKLSGSK